MRGFVEWIIALIPLVALMIIFVVSPPGLDLKIKQTYVANIESVTAQDTLTSVLHASNIDTLSQSEKSTYEILSEKLLLPEQKIDFLKNDLENLVTSKCFILDVGSPKQYNLIDESCRDLTEKGNKVTAKIVLPYNPDNLTENIVLVIK